MQRVAYYHCTPVENLPSILRGGLDPARCDRLDEEPMPFVFLSRVPFTSFYNDVEIAVLEVTPPPALTERFVYDLGEYIRVPFVIPPAYIRVIGTQYGTTRRPK